MTAVIFLNITSPFAKVPFFLPACRKKCSLEKIQIGGYIARTFVLCKMDAQRPGNAFCGVETPLLDVSAWLTSKESQVELSETLLVADDVDLNDLLAGNYKRKRS
jgi:hypothetical protein